MNLLILQNKETDSRFISPYSHLERNGSDKMSRKCRKSISRSNEQWMDQLNSFFIPCTTQSAKLTVKYFLPHQDMSAHTVY